MSNKKCIVDGCDKQSRTSGYCGGHYSQISRHGEVTSKKLNKVGFLRPGDKEKIISLLKETTLTYKEIGKMFGVSLGPISQIKNKYKIKRPDVFSQKRKNCKMCNQPFLVIKLDRETFCSYQCYMDWKQAEFYRTNGYLTEKEEKMVVRILKETELLPYEIGETFDVSGHYICRVRDEHKIKRITSGGFDNVFVKCGTCGGVFRTAKLDKLAPKGFCSLNCYKLRPELNVSEVIEKQKTKNNIKKKKSASRKIKYSCECTVCKKSFNAKHENEKFDAVKFCSNKCYITWQLSVNLDKNESYTRGRLKDGDEEKIVEILKTTTLINTEIGSIFCVSRGPIDIIKEKYNIKRPFGKQKISFNSIKRCYTCGIIFKKIKDKSKTKRHFCCKECYSKWQTTEENRGKNSPSWDGGREYRNELDKLMETDEGKNWRKSIFERDNYSCSICKRTGTRLEAHHIKKKSLFPDLIFDVSNGITLCWTCHHIKGIHVNGGRHEKEFLKIVKSREATINHISGGPPQLAR